MLLVIVLGMSPAEASHCTSLSDEQLVGMSHDQSRSIDQEQLGHQTFKDYMGGKNRCVIPSSFCFIHALGFVVNNARCNRTPLVLDLDGDGRIELTRLDPDTKSFFDIDGDGFAEQIAWIRPDDGLLVRDLNGDGRIDNASELFGPTTQDGFTQLARLDTNADGVIDHADPDFSSLLIWRDADGDGTSTPPELHELSTFSISSIDVAASRVKQTNEGNPVTHIGNFEVTQNGRTEIREIHDVWFAYLNMNSRYNREVVLDPRVSLLPNLRGYGIIPDLHIAMSLDNEGPGNLLAQVAQFAEIPFESILLENGRISASLRDILFRWAGVHEVTPDSRGPFVDARELAFIERLSDKAFLQRGIHSSPFIGAGRPLSKIFEHVFERYSARFISQLIGEKIFRFERGYTLVPGSKTEPKFAYIPGEDAFEGIEGLKPSGLNTLEVIATRASQPDLVWKTALSMIEFTVGIESMPPEDLTLLSRNLLASGASTLSTHSLALLNVRQSLLELVSGRDTRKRLKDSDNDGHLVGSAEDDLLIGDRDAEILEGGAGADEIRGNAGDDVLNGQAGSDYLRGGAGSDTYVFELGSGIDVIFEGNDNRGYDVIELGVGITLDDLVFERRGNTDLMINLRDNPLDAILIENQFNGISGIETLRFADGSEESLSDRSYIVNGTSHNDRLFGITKGGSIDDGIRGFGGNDVINGKRGNDMLDGGAGDDRILGDYGADVLIGGPGNDLLRGGSGNDELGGGPGDDEVDGGLGDDLYRYESGNDRFKDLRGSADRLIVENVHSTDVNFERIGKDLKIILHDGGSLLLTRHFAGARIETISFSDTSLDTSTIEYTNHEDSGNNAPIDQK